MRRWAIALSFVIGFACIGVSTGITKDKPAGPVSVEYRGQSFFIVTSSKGTRIAFDPHFVAVYWREREFLKAADIICVSHNHNDHTRTEVFKENKDGKIYWGLKGRSLKADWNVVNETFKDVKVRTVGVFHDTNLGADRGKNTIFIIEVDGWRIVHLGDLGHPLTEKQLKQIGAVDVLMIPVGGIYTLNGAEAKKVVAQIKPKEYIFPMHYGTKIFDDILPVDEFLEGQADRDVVRLSESIPEAKRENSIQLGRDANRKSPLIVQLHYWEKEKKEK